MALRRNGTQTSKALGPRKRSGPELDSISAQDHENRRRGIDKNDNTYLEVEVDNKPDNPARNHNKGRECREKCVYPNEGDALLGYGVSKSGDSRCEANKKGVGTGSRKTDEGRHGERRRCQEIDNGRQGMRE